MKKLILLAAITLCLSGCAEFQAITGATITQGQVDAARNSYDGGFLAGLHRYALLPRCLDGQTFIKNQCHAPATLKTMRGYDKAIEVDFNDVQAKVGSGDTSAISNSWTILNNAIASANTFASNIGL